jgi:alkanesulfonate monooxygenase SsuD/methylene tetrahydromethanopterin reductase-like flavin-dependent oxidoreductase (luciferase family)
MEEEFAALGLSNFAERGAVTNEYLLLFKELWTKENPEFHGKYVKVSDVGFLPKPIQRPHPPIWIGGHSLAALRRVALVGDGWMPIALRPPSLLRPPEMEDKMARLRRLLRDAGRAEDEVAISVTAPVVVTKTLASPRPLLRGTTPDENRRRFAAATLFASLPVMLISLRIAPGAAARSPRAGRGLRLSSDAR